MTGSRLDFNRFPTFFKGDTTDERVAKINSLVKRVREMLDEVGRQRGRRLVLAVRVPSNFGRTPPDLASSREIGCDPATWANNGWIDFLTVSEFLYERFDLPIKPWREAIRGVPIYGGIECTEGGSREQYLNADKYRRAARHLWQDGADGIYLFNFFTTREYGAEAWEPPFEVLRDLSDPDGLSRDALHNEPILVQARELLAFDSLPCERVPIGEADDYKPCIGQLPDGELLLTCFHQHQREDKKVLEQTLLYRSQNDGRTWLGPEKLDLLGREPYLTVLSDGTVFVTGHLLASDVRNTWGYTTGFLHRSTDRGQTWHTIRIESEDVKPKAGNHTSRNVLQLSDGTLLVGVDYDGGGGPYFVWRSADWGETWQRNRSCQPHDFKSVYGFFGGETWLWQARSGKVWAFVRVDSNELPIAGRPIQAGDDQSDHFVLFSSVDQGRTFDRIRDFGDYGEMYMSLLRLRNKRLLLNPNMLLPRTFFEPGTACRATDSG